MFKIYMKLWILFKTSVLAVFLSHVVEEERLFLYYQVETRAQILYSASSDPQGERDIIARSPHVIATETGGGGLITTGSKTLFPQGFLDTTPLWST